MVVIGRWGDNIRIQVATQEKDTTWQVRESAQNKILHFVLHEETRMISVKRDIKFHVAW